MAKQIPRLSASSIFATLFSLLSFARAPSANMYAPLEVLDPDYKRKQMIGFGIVIVVLALITIAIYFVIKYIINKRAKKPEKGKKAPDAKK